MGMFDYYSPQEELVCPHCGNKLNEWQGKEGPCALFTWEQNHKNPTDQQAGDDSNISKEDRKKVLLPKSFEIYSYDCPEHNPIFASCLSENNIWSIIKIKQ